MFDQRQLAAFETFAHGQAILAGCAVRNESNARHAAVAARRFSLVVLVLLALPLSILVFAQGGVIWIGAIFVIAPVGAFAFRTASGISAKPKLFQAIVTEHSLLLIDASDEGPQPGVAHAYPRLTLAEVRSSGGQLIMTSAGSPIKLLTDPADAIQMARLLQRQPAS